MRVGNDTAAIADEVCGVRAHEPNFPVRTLVVIKGDGARTLSRMLARVDFVSHTVAESWAN